MPAQNLDVMSHFPQPIPDLLRDPFLEEDLVTDLTTRVLRVFGIVRHAGGDAEPRAVERLLRGEVVLEHVEEDLEVALGLHEAALRMISQSRVGRGRTHHDAVSCEERSARSERRN